VELMARGAGRSSRWLDGPMAVQAVWSGHRRRKVGARVTMGMQITSQLDLVFAGLGDCFKDVIGSKGGHVILSHCPDPVRIRRMGPEGLRTYVGNRGVRMARSKAALIVTTAEKALVVPDRERRARMGVLKADLALYDRICAEIHRAESELAAVIDQTPAGVLVSLPGVGVPRASAYGAALGDRGGSPRPGRRGATRASSRSNTSPPGGPDPGCGSAEKDPSPSGKPSSRSAKASLIITPSSKPTNDARSPRERRRRWRRWRWHIELTGWPLPWSATKPSSIPTSGTSRRRAGPSQPPKAADTTWTTRQTPR